MITPAPWPYAIFTDKEIARMVGVLALYLEVSRGEVMAEYKDAPIDLYLAYSAILGNPHYEFLAEKTETLHQ